MVYNFFDKKPAGANTWASGNAVQREIMLNPQLAEEPYKSVRYYRHYRYMIPITIIIIGITITRGSQKLLNKSKRKRNKLCVNEGSEFHKRSVKSWL